VRQGGVRRDSSESVIPSASPKSRSAVCWLDAGLIASGILVLLALPRDTGGDSAIRFATMQSLLDGHIPHEPYSLVTPILALPLGAIGRALGHEADLAFRFNGIVFAGGLLSMWLILRGRVSGELLRAFLLVLVFGSLFPPAVVSLYGETVTAVFLGVGLLAVVAGRSGVMRAVGWSAAVVGVVNTPALIPAFAAVAVVLIVMRRSYWTPLAAVTASVVLTLIDLRLHTGGLSSPYEDDHGFETVLPFSGRSGFSYPALFGVLAILFSLGKGLLFYAPGLFLPTRRSLTHAPFLTRTRLLWLLVVACMVLIYCRWWAWYGGSFFGPRFFLFASIPASLAIAARLHSARDSVWAVGAIVGVLALSIWVCVVGAMGIGMPSICSQDNFALEHLCWYTPEFSALWRPLLEWPELSLAPLLFALLALGAFVRLSLPLLIAAAPRGRSELRMCVRALHEGERW
jgi:hypothetical protein